MIGQNYNIITRKQMWNLPLESYILAGVREARA